MKSIYRILFFQTLLLLLLVSPLSSQTNLQNPSLEDTPSDAMIPFGWFMCEEGTTPDILPGYWGVYNTPSDGNTFMGLITRPDNSFESVGQRLTPELVKEECYKITLDLAHSKTYAAYNFPIQLRIWLGNKKCKKQQLIYESCLIKNEDWKKHVIDFIPERDFNYIIFEAYTQKTRKGNILIDNISPIYKCDRV